jgi:choline transport protein
MSSFDDIAVSSSSAKYQDAEKVLTHTSAVGANIRTQYASEEDAELAEMGYKPELKRNFSVWSLLGVGFGLTNSWFGISASLVTSISSGGPLMIVYGILIIAVVSSFIGITLSELVSAYPNSGGQYYWTLVLAPKKYSRFWAYMCGALAWAGSVFSSTSTSLSIAQVIVGMHALRVGPDFVVRKWMVFVTFQLVNFIAFLFNCYGKVLPAIAKSALYISLLSYFVISITVLACSSGKYQSAHFVFVQFDNQTGWNSAAIAFITGLINPNWCFSCLDCATHMAEEAYEPERKIPIAIMGTVAIGFLTSFTYVIAMFFSLQNFSDILNSNTGVPIIDIYYQSVQNIGGTLFLITLFLLTAWGCTISGQTWMARLCWSFSRDNGLPGSHLWAQVNPKLGVPFNAHAMSCTWVAICGCLYMASTTGYNSLVVGTITFLLLSYSIPVVCLLLKGRNNIKHGPFWLGKLGLLSNIVTLAWTVFSCVFYSFPFAMPVEVNNMNYISVIMVGFCVYLVFYWYVRGSKTFREERVAHVDESFEDKE